MASINYAAKEINIKIVYYGPAMSGKTTNLNVIHQKIPEDKRSKLVSLATAQDRTLFFDFLNIDLGSVRGFSTKFQLYTVPGQVYYAATRKLVLRGVDGVVFVADSQAKKMAENIESLRELWENVGAMGLNPRNLPAIIQFNKREIPGAVSLDELQRAVNPQNFPCVEATAIDGRGVFEALRLIAKLIIDELNKKYGRMTQASPQQRAPSVPTTMPPPPPRIRPAPVAAPPLPASYTMAPPPVQKSTVMTGRTDNSPTGQCIVTSQNIAMDIPTDAMNDTEEVVIEVRKGSGVPPPRRPQSVEDVEVDEFERAILQQRSRE